MLNETSPNRWYELLRVTRQWRLEWDLEQLLQRVAKEAVEFLDFDRGVVFLLSPDGVTRRAVWLKDASQQFDDARREIQRIAEKVVQNGRPVFAHVVGEGSAAKKKNTGANIGDAYCVPLTAGRGILGALYVDSRGTLKRDKQNQEVLEMLGLQAAAALEHAQLYHSAITDPLTGLYSHRHFQLQVEQAVRRALRSDQKLSLLILDLDHFKALNDSEGHETGNRCLVQVAELLRATLRSADIIARFGGDEFELLLPDTTLKDALTVAEKIRLKIEKLRFGKTGKNRRVAGTIGAAAFPDNAADAQQLFLRADEALYKAKQLGRNRAVASDATVKLPAREGLRGETPPSAPTSKSAAAPATDRRAPPPEAQPGAITQRIASTAEQIDGYSLVKRLGLGSMGEVLLVRQEELEREVALKRPLTPHLTPEQVQSFEREAKITASLNHPGVITVFTLGRDSDGRRYYTMKPLQGLSLAQVLEGRRKEELKIMRQFTLSRLLEVVQRVAETIAYAHQRDVFHLDLTPANVVLGEFGEVTVIDWGASASSTSTPGSRGGINYHLRGRTNKNGKLTFLVGSAGSLAPEQLPGSKRKPSAATDVHALGALLYEILTGRGPYDRENTHDVLDAILAGTIIRPERVAPKSGIDPTLSQLCMNALHKDAKLRPTAAEFAQGLGRYVRREMEFTVTRFGPHETPLDMKDWRVAYGDWKIVDGEFVSNAPKGENNLLMWRHSAPGAFRLVVEGWVEQRGELALLGHNRADHAGQGYIFQFGAEWNTCTKLNQFAAIAGRFPQPGRHYRLEMEYQEGWVYCYIDGEKIFEHRELFHFPGNQIGLYTCDPGVHFKVIEIQRQSWGLNVPAVRMADAYFHSKQFDKAIEMYQELSERLGDRLEGLEAKLKLGLTYAAMGLIPKGRTILQSLRGTVLEPFALAEEAMLDFPRQPVAGYVPQPRRGLVLLKKLLSKHPDSPARSCIIDVSFHNPNLPDTQERLEFLVEVKSLASRSLPHPTMMEIVTHRSSLSVLLNLGHYQRAMDEGLAYQKLLLPGQRDINGARGTLMMAMLALGREDLLTFDPFEIQRWGNYDAEWIGITPVFDLAVRQGKLQQLIERIPQQPTPLQDFIRDDMDLTLLWAHVALGQVHIANDLFVRRFLARNTHDQSVSIALAAWIEAQKREHFQELAARVESANPTAALLIPCLRVREAVEHRDFESAARLLSGIPADRRDASMLVFDALLLSLGVIDGERAEYKAKAEQELVGVPRDLALMFLGYKDPSPGKNWPHPGFMPRWRLWLALWLEARGKPAAARATVKPSIDPRYGRTHSQPAIEALLARTGRGAGLKSKKHKRTVRK